jgi:outer membrane protein assembly factor BamE (lipoprotein component of BamABCDE complex)
MLPCMDRPMNQQRNVRNLFNANGSPSITNDIIMPQVGLGVTVNWSLFSEAYPVNHNHLIPILIVIGSITGCQTVGEHRAAVQDNSTDRMTVGKVQKEIRVGMSGADVAIALGSPNIVTTDEERREVWVYDKIATDRAYSGSSGGVNALFLGVGPGAAGGLGGGGSSSASASSTSQRTLTVVIKFDKDGKVRDFAYHTSRF